MRFSLLFQWISLLNNFFCLKILVRFKEDTLTSILRTKEKELAHCLAL